MSTSSPLPAGLVTAVDHVGVAVPDYDAAIAFYRDTFGMQVVHEEVNEEQGVREAMLAVGDGDTRVQLLAPLTPSSSIARVRACSRSPTGSRTWTPPARRCATEGCGCSTTLPGAARPGAGSTSC